MNMVILLIGISLPANAQNKVCREWFKNLDIPRNKECLIKCTASDVDMGTFDCPSDCPKLCKEPLDSEIAFQLVDLYPGLTAEEKVLAIQSPIKTLNAYQLALKSERLCSKIYAVSKTNDESDACRHFMWSSLLEKNLGHDFSSKVLEAHENNPRQPSREKDMDTFNNKVGQEAAQKLIRDDAFDEGSLIKSFKSGLKKDKFIIIKPGTKEIP